MLLSTYCRSLIILPYLGNAHVYASQLAGYLMNETSVSLSTARQTATSSSWLQLIAVTNNLPASSSSLLDVDVPSITTAWGQNTNSTWGTATATGASLIVETNSQPHRSRIAASGLLATNPTATLLHTSSTSIFKAAVTIDLSVSTTAFVHPTWASSRLIHTPKASFRFNNTLTTSQYTQPGLWTQLGISNPPSATASYHRPTPGYFEPLRISAALQPTGTTGRLGILLSPIGAGASAAEAQSGYQLTTSPLAISTMSDTLVTEDPTTTNALSILLSALPTVVASDIESAYNIVTGTSSASPHKETSQPTSDPTSHAISIPTTIPTVPSTSATSTSTSSPSSAALSSPTPSTLMTIAGHASSTTNSSSSATPTSTMAASDSSSQQLPNASVAGIATGVAAGAVLLILAGAYLWRRRSQGKSPFAARNASHRSRSSRGSKRIFPEVAWLYDPRMTPSHAGSPTEEHHPIAGGRGLGDDNHGRGHTRAQSATSPLIPVPEPREGAVEMSESGSHTPPLRAANSPLLAPEAIGVAREYSPDRRSSHSQSPGGSDRRSGSGSPSSARRARRSTGGQSRVDFSRPMTAIWEESRRPSTDGLLQPGGRNVARHST